MDGIHDHLMGDYDYEVGPGSDGEFEDNAARARVGGGPSAYRTVEVPDLPVVDGNFYVVGTPRMLTRTVGGSEVAVLNLVVRAEPYRHRRADGRVETITSPPMAVAVWGEDALRLRDLTEGSAVSVRGFLRVAAYRRRESDPAVEVYRPRVDLLARLTPAYERPRHWALKRPGALADGYFSDEEAIADTARPARPSDPWAPGNHFGHDDADTDYDEHDPDPDRGLPSRTAGESDAEWIGRCAEAGWSYDRENDNPFAGGPTADGFSRDRWAANR